MHHSKRDMIAKIVIIGDIGVGKSSVTIRYVYDKFDLKQQSTLGAAYMQKTCAFTQDGPHKNRKEPEPMGNEQKNSLHNLKLQIWDTAGQQKYRAIAKLYYRDCRVAILVYDITRRQSFQNLKKWHEQLFKSAPKGIILFVVANKIDLLDTLTNQTPVTSQEGKNYAKQIQAQFFQVSAKNRTGIQQLFTTIAGKIGPIVLSEKKQSGKQKLDESFSQPLNSKKKKKCCSE